MRFAAVHESAHGSAPRSVSGEGNRHEHPLDPPGQWARHVEKVPRVIGGDPFGARVAASTSLWAAASAGVNHQPLNRQSKQFVREGIELSVATMADHVGACAATLMPIYDLIKAHVFAGERIHGDDTPPNPKVGR